MVGRDRASKCDMAGDLLVRRSLMPHDSTLDAGFLRVRRRSARNATARRRSESPLAASSERSDKNILQIMVKTGRYVPTYLRARLSATIPPQQHRALDAIHLTTAE